MFLSFYSLCFSFLFFIFSERELLGDTKLINGSNLVQGAPFATNSLHQANRHLSDSDSPNNSE